MKSYSVLQTKIFHNHRQGACVRIHLRIRQCWCIAVLMMNLQRCLMQGSLNYLLQNPSSITLKLKLQLHIFEQEIRKKKILNIMLTKIKFHKNLQSSKTSQRTFLSAKLKKIHLTAKLEAKKKCNRRSVLITCHQIKV